MTLPKLKKGVAVTGNERVKLAEGLKKRYERDGVTIPELAEEIGRSQGFVRNMLKEAGVKSRERFGSQAQKVAAAARRESARLAPYLKERYENGASIEALTKEVRHGYYFVVRTLTEAGVTLRKPPGIPKSEREKTAPGLKARDLLSPTFADRS